MVIASAVNVVNTLTIDLFIAMDAAACSNARNRKTCRRIVASMQSYNTRIIFRRWHSCYELNIISMHRAHLIFDRFASNEPSIMQFMRFVRATDTHNSF